MKQIITFLAALLMAMTTFAQQGINYKAVIKDNLGNVVAGQPITVQFSILKGSGQTNQYTETHNPTTDANGVVVLTIGGGTQNSGNYSTIDWGSDEHWLNVQVDIGAGLVNMGTTQFMAVPYALNAANVSGLEALDEGNSVGWRLKDRDPNFYGVIGGNAVDLSISDISAVTGATGNGSFAANYRTTAQGASSSAFGWGTIAAGDNSLAIGQFNVADTNGLFMIGSGTDDSNRKNSLSLFLNGSFIVGSSQLNDDNSISSDDRRFFFNKLKGAFRSGFANGDQWDDINVGDYSTAFGFVTEASGARSTALGSGTKATGFATTALGNYNKEDNDAYFIVGNGTGDTDRKSTLVVKSTGDFIVGSSQLDDDNTTPDDNARLFFNKAKGAFRAGLVDGNNWDDSEVGSYSVSMGLNTKAMGQNSFAMGENAYATGFNAISIGNQTISANSSSVALGAGSKATGVYSTAMNLTTNANAMASTAMGRNNIGGGNTNAWIETEALFEIGNGVSDAERSNALTVLKNGTITAPSFDIAEITDPKALVTKEYLEANASASTGLEYLDETDDATDNGGWRLIGRNPANYGPIGNNAVDLSQQLGGDTSPGATGSKSIAMGLRTTASGGNSTAMGNTTKAIGTDATAMGSGSEAIGNFSTAMGSGSEAIGLVSTAMGSGSEAIGLISTAMGALTTATGDYSTAMGLSTTASEYASTAMGRSTTASGEHSTAMGYNTTASGVTSTAIGRNTVAFGENATALGFETNASAINSTSMGNNTNALGINSTAMGLQTIATANASTVIGKYNISDVNGLFMVGNGTSTSNRKNAFIIKEDGKTGINTSTPASLFEVAHGSVAPSTSGWTNALSIRNIPNNNSWQFWTASTGMALYRNGAYRGGFDGTSGAYTQASDRRVKKDITPLETGTLNKVMQLNAVSYLMIDQTDTNRNLGLISQEVQEIFPSITHYVEESDLLTLSYTELIPILIKAMQEQQAIIEAQNSQLKNQDSKINGLTAELTELKTLDQRVKQLEQLIKAAQQ